MEIYESILAKFLMMISAELTGSFLFMSLAEYTYDYFSSFINIILPFLIAFCSFKYISNNYILYCVVGIFLFFTYDNISSYLNENKKLSTLDTIFKTCITLLSENVGGYIGILCVQKNLKYYDDTPDCYSKSLLRLQLTRLVYNSVVNPTNVLLYPPCIIAKYISQTISYNINNIKPLLDICLLMKNTNANSVLQPIIHQVLATRYFNASLVYNKNKLKKSFANIYTTPLLPRVSIQTFALAERSVYTLQNIIITLRTDMIANIYKSTTLLKLFPHCDILELLTTIIIRSMNNYMNIINKSPDIKESERFFKYDPSNSVKKDFFEFSLKNKIYKNMDKSHIYQTEILMDLLVTDKQLSALAMILVNEITHIDHLFWGFHALKNISDIHLLIYIHIKYLVLYIISNISFLIKTKLDPYEEVQLIFNINYFLFSNYLYFIAPKKVTAYCTCILEQIEKMIYIIKLNSNKFLYQNDQSSILFDDFPVNINSDYIKNTINDSAEYIKLVQENNLLKQQIKDTSEKDRHASTAVTTNIFIENYIT